MVAEELLLSGLPKGYQISQYDRPVVQHGYHRDFGRWRSKKKIGVQRIHMEEDAGKSLHEGFPDSGRNTSLDFNRSGVPLVEIVTEPDLRSSAEAHDYLSRLKQILEYLDVSDGNMEEGSLRCDANVSVRKVGERSLEREPSSRTSTHSGSCKKQSTTKSIVRST